ncbi:hypothetical protein CKJ90_28150 [Klebsiella pneumoniae]|nr:hypothetical protein CKJ90_28150 [Klebsiella pneumoniae]
MRAWNAKTDLRGGRCYEFGARTRTNAAGVEQRACRAGPEGVSRCAANNRTQFDGESGRRKQNSLVGGFF